jgi:putative ABC transport system ATP-binding protein
MAKNGEAPEADLRKFFAFFRTILGPEKNYYYLALIYAIGIGLLSLATPISVQMLINTVANTGLTTPLVVLTVTLFVLLLIAGLLNALRIHLMDLFSRRFYARMVSEISLRSVYALNPFFDDLSMGALFNRYFDTIIVQKTLPNLLVGGFTIVLQAAVGFVLVSLYHPLFLVFNIVVVAMIWLVWLVWGKRAIRSAIELSHRKHAAAAWLEGLGSSNGFFKSKRHINEAIARTDAVTRNYIDQHALHFRHHFAQTLSFLFIYAAASAILLGLGGWLVIQGELSLGQLVAAELVLSVVYVGISQMGIYLAYFYELCGAVDELSLFLQIEQEEPEFGDEEFLGDSGLEFVNARGDARGTLATMNFEIPAGARVLAAAEVYGVQEEFNQFLKRHIPPEVGYVTLGGLDIRAVRAHTLRQQVIVLDRPNAIEMSIREFLELSGEGASAHTIVDVLRTVGLEHTIAQLDEGLDTPIASTGWPLTIPETMQLKLASAIIARPRVLVLTELFDAMNDETLKRSLDRLQDNGDTTIVYFSGRNRRIGFSHFLFLGIREQSMFRSFEALAERCSTGDCEYVFDDIVDEFPASDPTPTRS